MPRTDSPVSACVARRYSAAPESVFNAWLSPAMLGRFMFGPAVRDEKIIHLEVDARVGGPFSFLVRRQGVEIEHLRVYREIERPHRLAFTWGVAGESAGESVVEIDIAAVDEGAELTLTHHLDPQWADYRERVRDGWAKMLDALAAALLS